MSDKLFGVWFAFCALLSLAVVGVGIWVAITIVQWLVTK